MTIDATAVAVALVAAEPVDLAAAVGPPASGGLPTEPGFYAWWSDLGAIAVVPHHPHPHHDELGLLYVGISPKRASSSGTIRSRVAKHHIGGNTASSTLRLVLAALLLDELELRPRATGKKVVLDKADNGRLRDWQRAHLRLSWCKRAEPWQVEDDVIAIMEPPLNMAANRAHPFYATVDAARSAFRINARAGK